MSPTPTPERCEQYAIDMQAINECTECLFDIVEEMVRVRDSETWRDVGKFKSFEEWYEKSLACSPARLLEMEAAVEDKRENLTDRENVEETLYAFDCLIVAIKEFRHLIKKYDALDLRSLDASLASTRKEIVDAKIVFERSI